MRYRVALAAFLLVGVVPGCAGDEHHPQPVYAPKTGRFTVTIDANGPDGHASIRAWGSFDDERHLFSLSTDVSGFVPGLDGPTAVVATPDALFIDCPYLTRLLRSPTKWIKVSGPGSERVRASFIDPLRRLSDVSRDRLVHGSTMRFAGGESEGSALVSLEYSDIGAPVVIEPPAADQVTDETAAVNRLLGGTTGG